jgi:hypothetical protein
MQMQPNEKAQALIGSFHDKIEEKRKRERANV